MPFHPDLSKGKCFNRPELNHLFFVGSDKTNQVEKAKKICKGCPVIKECRAYAIVNQIEYGIFGGMTPFERRGAALFVEQEEPSFFESRRSTLHVRAHLAYVVPSSPSHTFHLQIRTPQAFGPSVEEQMDNQPELQLVPELQVSA